MWTRSASVFLLLIAALCSAAQSPKDSAKALESSLVGQRRVMRGFSLDREVVWRWDGSKLVQEPSLGHMLAVVEVKSVKLKGDRLEIDGVRHELLRASDTVFEFGKDALPIRVRVEFAGGDPATVIPAVADSVFYPDEQSAVADLPREYRGMLPQDATPNCCSPRPNRTRAQVCPADAATGERVRMGQPRLVRSADPEFSEEARRKRISGNVQVGVRVDKSGNPTDLWVVRPLGVGLDDKAVEAVSRYQFQPASCAGLPVAVQLFVEVNFQIF